MNKLIIILAILIAFVYIKYYTKIKFDTKIVQVTLDNISYDTLQEKYPLVINDAVVSLTELINKTFRHLYSFKYTNSNFDKNIKMNLSKYALFHNNTDSEKFVYVSNPLNAVLFKMNKNIKNEEHSYFITADKAALDDIQLVKILMKPHNVLVIPYGWLFICEHQLVNVFLSDVANILLAKYKNLF